MIPFSPQIPEITVLVGVLVYLANSFLGASLTSEQVANFVSALTQVIVALSAVWSWFNARKLIRENVNMSAKLAVLSASSKPKKKV